MWIGSKVPPSIPVRTSTRIGPRWGHQAQCPCDVGHPAAHPAHRVDVNAPDPDREVDTWQAVCKAGGADRLPLADPGAREHKYLFQIRERDLHSGGRLDGDRIHAGHLTRERDGTRHRGCHRITERSVKVDAPVAPIPANGSKRLDHHPGDRAGDAYRYQKQKFEQTHHPYPTLRGRSMHCQRFG